MLAPFSGQMPIHFHQRDLFSAPAVKYFRTWVVSNPPYGERLKAFFTPTKLLEQIVQVYSPERLGLLVSDNQSRELLRRELAASLNYELEGKWSFSNGGLPVQFLIFSQKVDISRRLD